MGNVKQNEQTSEEAVAENAAKASEAGDLIKDLSSDFSKSLDLPAAEVEEDVEEEVVEEVRDEQEEPEAVEESAEEEDEAEGLEDEELIPRSKVDKRFQQLTAREKALEAKVAELEKQTEANKDPQQAKLEKMSEAELENLVDEIETAKFQAISDGDQAKHQELVALGRNTNKALRTAPERFKAKQEKLFQAASQQIAMDPDIGDVAKAGPEILKIAEGIYSKQGSAFKKLEDGQAQALYLAAEHYKQLNTISSGKSKVSSKVSDLKRQNNKLKKKTSLDGKVTKGDLNRKALGKVKARAHSKDANIYDKTDFAVKSGMLGDLSRYQK